MVSYNHKASLTFAKRLYQYLHRNGFKTWIDWNDIDNDMYTSMATAVESSDIILVILSNEYCNSEHCIKECEYAWINRKHILTIKHTDDFEFKGAVGTFRSINMQIICLAIYTWNHGTKKLMFQYVLEVIQKMTFY